VSGISETKLLASFEDDHLSGYLFLEKNFYKFKKVLIIFYTLNYYYLNNYDYHASEISIDFINYVLSHRGNIDSEFYERNFVELEQIGQGSFFSVHRVMERATGELFAVKRSLRSFRYYSIHGIFHFKSAAQRQLSESFTHENVDVYFVFIQV
jgi:hypothetical protein